MVHLKFKIEIKALYKNFDDAGASIYLFDVLLKLSSLKSSQFSDREYIFLSETIVQLNFPLEIIFYCCAYELIWALSQYVLNTQ